MAASITYFNRPLKSISPNLCSTSYPSNFITVSSLITDYLFRISYAN